MISREKKEKLVDDLSATIGGSKAVIFTDFTGLTTTEINELKAGLKAKKAGYRVVKKSLLPFISNKTGLEFNLENHKSSLAIAYGEDDGEETAKALSGFAKSHEKLVVLGGILNRVFADSEKIRELAMLPSREELLAKLMYLLNPAGSFVRALASPLAGLVGVINSIKSKK